MPGAWTDAQKTEQPRTFIEKISSQLCWRFQHFNDWQFWLSIKSSNWSLLDTQKPDIFVWLGTTIRDREEWSEFYICFWFWSLMKSLTTSKVHFPWEIQFSISEWIVTHHQRMPTCLSHGDYKTSVVGS